MPNAEPSSAPELPEEVANQVEQPGSADQPTNESPTTANEPLWGSVDIDDPETSADVDSIVHEESDALLEDKKSATKPPVTSTAAAKRPSRLRRAWRAWRSSRRAVWATAIAAGLAVLIAGVVPASRYFVLNTVGVRASTSVTVIDSGTQLPLKNVTVVIGPYEGSTNREGVATLRNVRLGSYKLSIKRLAFRSYDKPVTIGWGSNPLGPFSLDATGVRYVVIVADYLSGKPIDHAEVSNENVSALSDAHGKATLTMDSIDSDTLSITINAKGYRSDAAVLAANSPNPPAVLLVPAGKNVFVNHTNGRYDLYTSDLDGKNSQLLLAGSGNELADMSLVVSPDNTTAAWVATRDTLRDDDGFLLRSLTLVNLADGSYSIIDHAEQIELIDWIGDRLVYRSTIAGPSGASPQRNKLISYNTATKARLQLALANQFNTVIAARGTVYYATSSTDPEASLGLFSINPDGSERTRLSKDEIWTGLRTTYNTLSLQSPDGWREYNLRTKEFTDISAPPAITTYAFTDAPTDTGESVWVGSQNNTTALLLYNLGHDTSRAVVAQPGITSPIRWLDGRRLIYRVATGNEIADYAVSLDGGQPHKIIDVTATYAYALSY